MWRVIHRYDALVVYLTGLWQSVVLGSDVADGSVPLALWWLLQVPLVVVLCRRIRERGLAAPTIGVERGGVHRVWRGALPVRFPPAPRRAVRRYAG